MASASRHSVFVPATSLPLICFFLALLCLPLPLIYGARGDLDGCKFDAIYQVGDANSDTGNLVRENSDSAALAFARLPYGKTFFKYPTGRCCDGLLTVDYFALATRLPFLNPYMDRGADFRHGANFAVAGSTALASHILASHNVFSTLTNSSLQTQLDWMFTHFNSICYTTKDCVEKLKTAVFIVGEIGINDYRYALFQGKTFEELLGMVPEVTGAIKEAVRTVISYGGNRVVVPGNFPMGCLPIYLTKFQTNDSAAYDEFRCLRRLNLLAKHHNDHLRRGLDELKLENPNSIIVYGDHYNAFEWLLRHHKSLGFDVNSTLKSCCGVGGEHNFDLAKMCGDEGVTVCSNPDVHISWDGIHLTQNANRFITDWLIRDILPQLKCEA